MTKEIAPISEVDVRSVAESIKAAAKGNGFFAVIIGEPNEDGTQETRVLTDQQNLYALVELLAMIGLQITEMVEGKAQVVEG